MRLFFKAKDGGTESTVTGYWLIESKQFISVCLLKFEGQSRAAFHTHAFNCWSFIIKGSLIETMLNGEVRKYSPFKPFITRRMDFHKVDSGVAVTWLFTVRGRWLDEWREWLPTSGLYLKLTHGRKVLKEGLNAKE